jgi:hypothetical protein
MRISVEKLIKKMMVLNADPETKTSYEALHLKEFLNENKYIEKNIEFVKLTNQWMELTQRLNDLEKELKHVVDYKVPKKPPTSRKKTK